MFAKLGVVIMRKPLFRSTGLKKQTVITIISKLNFMKENLCLTRVQNSKIVWVILNESETEIEQGLCIPFDCGCLRTDHKLNPY